MTTALATTDKQQQLQHRSAVVGELTVQDLVDRKRKILEVMKAVMIEGEHYGKIPGCGDKPALFKAGAEVLATTFGLAPKFVIDQTDLPGGHREIRITCQLVSIGSGAVIGEGVGSCSTMESKYRWRGGSRVCPDCGKAAIITNKFGKGEFAMGWFCFPKKGGCGGQWRADDQAIAGQSLERVENPDAADVWNTVLKMAKKRAQVDATLTAVGASDLLTQDIEELPPASRDFDKPRHDAVDADFVEHNEKGPPSTDATVNAHDNLGEQALLLAADIEAAKTVAEVKALAPRCNELPKRSKERAAVWNAYKARIDLLDKQAATA